MKIKSKEHYHQIHDKFVVLAYIHKDYLFPFNNSDEAIKKAIRSLVRKKLIHRRNTFKNAITYDLTEKGKEFANNIMQVLA